MKLTNLQTYKPFFKYIHIIIMLLAIVMASCDVAGTTDDVSITDISAYTISYETKPQGTATSVSPTWSNSVSEASYAMSYDTPVGTVSAPTINTSTGIVTIDTGTTAGIYTITATGSGSYSGTATVKLYITTAPGDKTALTAAINAGIAIWGNTGDFNYIITTAVTDMSLLFQDTDTTDGVGYQLFNGDISKWDTSNVTNMQKMFERAAAFNQPIGDWNTSAVQSVHSMFRFATMFNQDIDGWNVGAVTSSIAMVADSGMARDPCWYNRTLLGFGGLISPRPADCPTN